MTTPTQKTLEMMRKNGYTCFIVEYFHAIAKKRMDLAGFIDILALKENEIIGIQTTSTSNIQARVEKILKHKNFTIVKKSGIKIVVQGWELKKVDKRKLWECKEIKL